MAVKTIGTGTLGVTPDYSDINSWDSYLNALGAFTENETARVLWAGSGNELALSQQTLDGSQPGAFQIILEAGDTNGNSGGGFKDNSAAATNALRYNASNGACVRFTGAGNSFQVHDPRVTLRYLQFRKDANYNELLNMQSGESGKVVDSCILDIATDNWAHIIQSNNAITVENSLLHVSDCLQNNSKGVKTTQNGTLTLTNCTIAVTDASLTLGRATETDYAGDTVVLKNVAFYGWKTDYTGNGTLTASFCATNNSTASSALTGSDHQFNLVAADEWESVTHGSEDFRLKSTSTKCKDTGTSTGAPAVDIIGQSRS